MSAELGFLREQPDRSLNVGYPTTKRVPLDNVAKRQRRQVSCIGGLDWTCSWDDNWL